MRLHKKCAKCGYTVPKGHGKCLKCGSTKMIMAGMKHSVRKLARTGKTSPAERIRDSAPSIYSTYKV